MIAIFMVIREYSRLESLTPVASITLGVDGVAGRMPLQARRDFVRLSIVEAEIIILDNLDFRLSGMPIVLQQCDIFL